MTRRPDRGPRDCNADGCCEGVSVETPRALYNRPGLNAIRYRTGTQPLFKETLLARLSRKDRYQALGPLTARTDEDFTVALLDAWATVADVLTFYQERIANEAYLRTATERYSVWELARLVGYELRPGLAATTYLAFFADESEAAPPEIDIPEGTPVQNAPRMPETLPQTFETVEPIRARAEWNRLRPRLTSAQKVRLDYRKVHFQGANLNLRVGDTLLFVHKDLNEAAGPSTAGAKWTVRQVTRVEPDAPLNRTTVFWSWEAGTSERDFLVTAEETTDNLVAYVFRTSANAFGHNAPDWRALPDVAKATYLGITDPQELLDSEIREWPQFVLQAPTFPALEFPAAALYRDLEPTVEAIVSAVQAVTDQTANAFNTTALMSIPNAAVKTFAVITEILSAVAGIVPGLVESAADTAGDLTGSVSALVRFLIEVVRSLLPNINLYPINDNSIFQLRVVEDNNDNLEIQIWDDDSGAFRPLDITFDGLGKVSRALLDTLDKLFDALTKWAKEPADLSAAFDLVSLEGLLGEFIKSNPVFAPLDKVLSGDAFAGVGPKIQEATSAVGAVPERMAQAAGANIVGKVVFTTVQTVASITGRLVSTTDQIGRHAPLQELVRTPQTVALAAVFSARIAVAAIKGTFPNLNDADNVRTQVGSILNTLTNGGDAVNELLPDDDLLAALVDDDDTEDFLVAAAGGAAVLAGGTAALTLPAIMLALGPIYAPIVAPLILTAFLLDASVAEGAEKMEQAIRKAVKAALHPPPEPLSPRRPLQRLTTDAIDLDAVYSSVVPGGWLLLSLPNRSDERFNQEGLFRIGGVATASRSDFTLSGKVTRVSLSGADFTRVSPAIESRYRNEVRSTSLYCESERLEFAGQPDPSVVPEDCIELDRRIPDMGPGRKLVAIGEDSGSQEVVRKLVTIKDCEHDEDRTTLVLDPGLDTTRYLRESLIILGNVARATHGESKTEVLGSGDASRASQVFTLREPPLTHLASSDAPSGAVSTLEVRVNDIRWTERPNLFGASASDRVYETTIDDDGHVAVGFGDGINGARLHTGQENVVAGYRSGAGELGNLGVDEISLFMRRPLGVNEVTNPLPAVGGTDPERIEAAKQNVPTTTSLLERIVSLQDYEDFVRSFPGVGKALATWVCNGRDRKVLITAARQNGDTIIAGDSDDLLETLQTAIRRRSDRRIPVEIRGYRRRDVILVANVLIDDGFDPQGVKGELEAALRLRFSFEARRFGQPFTLSETVAVMQAVDGVVAVDVDSLYSQRPGEDEEPTRNARILAAGPRRDAKGRFEPAQLLLLGSVTLHVERLES